MRKIAHNLPALARASRRAGGVEEAGLALAQSGDLMDVFAVERLSLLYARGADRNEPALWEEIFAEDAVLEGPHFRFEGRAAICQSPAMLKSMYRMTQHRITNQLIDVKGDRASGETYCVAEHLFEEGGTRKVLTWVLRYVDSYRREDSAWVFTRRVLHLDWSETRTVDPVSA